MQEKRYYWLKLYDSFFENKTSKFLRRLPDGDKILIVYLKLQLKLLKSEGVFCYENLCDSLAEEIALMLDIVTCKDFMQNFHCQCNNFFLKSVVMFSIYIFDFIYFTISFYFYNSLILILFDYFQLILELVSLLWYYFFEQYSFVLKLLYIFLVKNIIRVLLTPVYCSFTFYQIFVAFQMKFPEIV